MLDNVRLLRELKDSKDEHTDLLVSPVIDSKNWPKTMESLEDYLRGHIGVKGVPLSYVARSKEAVSPSLYETETSFSSAEDEIFARAPIIEGGMRTATFKTDMMKVWGMISVTTRYLDLWNYVNSYQRTRDGRKAYRDLWDHLLGLDNVDNMASEAERLLVATHYSGERKRFNFECYMKIQKDQHYILEGIKAHWHAGIDPRSQVRHLIQGIKISYFDAVKAHIMATASLRTGYDGYVSLYKHSSIRSRRSLLLS